MPAKKFYFLSVIVISLFRSAYAQNPGDSLFNDSVHDIYLYFTDSLYWDSLVIYKAYDDTNSTSTFVSATAVIDGNTIDSTGVQLRGHSSYDHYPGNKKPFQLSFNQYIDGQEFDGLKSIDLNNFYLDPTFTREKLFLDFLNQNSMNAPRANYARLYLNDVYWGLYLLVERVNKTFCDTRFGNNDGNLFKGDHLENKCADLKFHTQPDNYYDCYELKTNQAINDWNDLIQLTDKINNTSDLEFHDTLENYLNTNTFTRNWAAYNLFADMDSYPFEYQHNYYVYHNLFTNKFEWISWDVNSILGIDKIGLLPDLQNTSVLFISPPANHEPLCERMLEDSIYLHQYLQAYCELANNAFIPLTLDSIITAMYTLIQPDVYADTMKMFSDLECNSNFNTDVTFGTHHIPALLPFIDQRSTHVLNELSSLGYTDCPAATGISSESETEHKLFLHPNPFNDFTRLNLSALDWNEDQLAITITDLSGIILFSVRSPSDEKTFSHQNEIEIGSDLPAGFYIIEVKTNDHKSVIKAMKL